MLRWCGFVTVQRASQEVKEAQMFREKMGHVSEWMSRAQLPRNVKEKIRAYYAEVSFPCAPTLLEYIPLRSPVIQPPTG